MLWGRFGLVAGLAAVTVAACTPPSPSAVKPSPTTSSSPAASVPIPMPSQVEPLATPPGVASPLVYPRLPIRAGTPRCHTAQLEVGFITGFAAAGSIQDTFEVRNVSATGCWVYGYVGFQTLDRDGRPVPQSINWSTHSYFGDSAPPSRILLPSGTTPLGVEPRTGHAFFNLFTNDVLCDADQGTVASLEIWPPDEFQPLTIRAQTLQGGLQFVFCGGFELNPLQVQTEPKLS